MVYIQFNPRLTRSLRLKLGLIEHSPLDRYDPTRALDVLTQEAAQWFDTCEKVQIGII